MVIRAISVLYLPQGVTPSSCFPAQSWLFGSCGLLDLLCSCLPTRLVIELWEFKVVMLGVPGEWLAHSSASFPAHCSSGPETTLCQGAHLSCMVKTLAPRSIHRPAASPGSLLEEQELGALLDLLHHHLSCNTVLGDLSAQ